MIWYACAVYLEINHLRNNIIRADLKIAFVVSDSFPKRISLLFQTNLGKQLWQVKIWAFCGKLV